MATEPMATRAAERLWAREGFAPTRQDAYLFDIDGTLLRSRDRVHYHSFSRAAAAVLGHELSLEGVPVHGNVDPAILRAAMRQAGVPEAAAREAHEQILAEMARDVLAQREEMRVEVMPGVRELLQQLSTQGAVLGVATGNLEPIGWLKIELAGLRPWFSFGGFSNGCEDRPEMIANALRLARAEAGPTASVCVVGDTPADIAAACAHSLPTIAVATGHFGFDELMKHEPAACATTLRALLDEVGR